MYVCEFITFQFAEYVRHFIMTQVYSPPATWYLCVKLSKRKAQTHTCIEIYIKNCILFYERRVKKPANNVQCHRRKKTHRNNNKKMIPMRKKERTYVCQLISIFLCDKRRNLTRKGRAERPMTAEIADGFVTPLFSLSPLSSFCTWPGKGIDKKINLE